MNEQLKKAYNNCKPEEWLDWDDERYVPLSDKNLRGCDGDIVGLLQDAIAFADGPTHLLFSGFRGSGKTTELLRLKHYLEKSGYTVVYVDTEEYLNLNVPATITDMWISIAAGFDSFLKKEKYIDDKRSFWKRLNTFLQSEIIIEGITIKAWNVAELQLGIKENLQFREKLNKAIAEKMPKLVKECYNFLDESIATIKENNNEKKETILILDSFEKLQGDSKNEKDVRNSIETIFIRHWKLLRTPCHAVYTVPPWVSFTEDAHDLGRTWMLPMCKVFNMDGTRHTDGINAMLQLLEKRMDVHGIFGNGRQLEKLAELSGGYPRDLLRMVREVILRNARIGHLPIPGGKLEADIARVTDIFTETFDHGLDGDDIPLLCKVANDHSLSGWPGEDKFRLVRLFNKHFVLSYQNGGKWLDIHPLLRNTPSMKAALAQCGRERTLPGGEKP